MLGFIDIWLYNIKEKEVIFVRKFLKTEIDLLYEEIQPEEEVLWRGKPRLIPNLSFITTLILILLTDIVFIIMRYLKLNNQFDINTIFLDWFLISLLISAIVIIFYLFYYSQKYYQNMINIFYVITSTRLLIFNSKKGKIVLSKLFPTVKLLRLKKTIFDSNTIVFDIEMIEDRMVEIGFNNINDADEVMDIIKHQLKHLKNKD